MSKKICYCYNFSEADIKNDVLQHDGRSFILEKILSAKKEGACQCAVKHPEGR
jgi:hypothetical protein